MDNLYDDIAPTEDIGRPAAEGSTSREPIVPDCSARPSRAEIDAERSSESVTVDKRHYNYLCKFKKNDIQRIRKACQVDISPAPGSDCNNIEVQFVKAQKGTCSKWRRRFIELYELLEDKLVIERINLAEIENENKLLGKINGISEHFSDQDNNTLEIICEKKSIDQIRKIVDKFKVKAAKQKVNLTVDSGNAEIQPS